MSKMTKHVGVHIVELKFEDRPELATFEWDFSIWDRNRHNILFHRSGRGEEDMGVAHKETSEWLTKIATAYNNNPTNDNNSEGATS